jgi:hypothetical protein
MMNEKKNLPQVLAMYLPQFHRVPENDEWWGEGFTDWVSVKNAKPLFDGHAQPHVPLNNNYYDLLDKRTMQWQAELMKQYGIDGMCIYHYWFKDGRRILEKPAENLLKWTDIDMPFCFSWANETWARSWSKIQGANAWNDIYEKNSKERLQESEKAVLLEQQYGNEADWKKHFDYLNQFFQDERYIKKNGKPVFVIYKTWDIPCLNEMLDCWQHCAKECGWSGMYIIGGQRKGKGEKCLDGELLCEPANEIVNFQEYVQNNSVGRIDYSTFWENILDNEQNAKLQTYYCGLTGYDDTPRRGKKGFVLENSSSQLFEHYIMRLMAKSEMENSDFVFVNAWNEWGEGMYLEPDEESQYAYLEALLCAKEKYKENLVSNTKKSTSSKWNKLQERADKFELYMNALDRWMRLREKGIGLVDYFKKNDIKHIGVYGLGILGNHFLEEMRSCDVSVEFLVDKQKDKYDRELPLFLPDESLPNCDAIVVTCFYYFDEIKEQVSTDCRLISLEDIILNCLTE